MRLLFLVNQKKHDMYCLISQTNNSEMVLFLWIKSKVWAIQINSQTNDYIFSKSTHTKKIQTPFFLLKQKEATSVVWFTNNSYEPVLFSSLHQKRTIREHCSLIHKQTKTLWADNQKQKCSQWSSNARMKAFLQINLFFYDLFVWISLKHSPV